LAKRTAAGVMMLSESMLMLELPILLFEWIGRPGTYGACQRSILKIKLHLLRLGSVLVAKQCATQCRSYHAWTQIVAWGAMRALQQVSLPVLDEAVEKSRVSSGVCSIKTGYPV